ncbi:hypothetical protein PR048_032128 [Dryococelus australis]|uniref:Uncharacterized protein n=1 Tax=Dryococelus australis TaxID=614101 RepID=A0ABQ9G1C6_9NEOP|nr:hypothetical protein PR048_032128 [Dryococelus australis]
MGRRRSIRRYLSLLPGRCYLTPLPHRRYKYSPRRQPTCKVRSNCRHHQAQGSTYHLPASTVAHYPVRGLLAVSSEVSMEQRRNARVGRLENPDKTYQPAVWFGMDSHVRESGSDRARNRTRFALGSKVNGQILLASNMDARATGMTEHEQLRARKPHALAPTSPVLAATTLSSVYDKRQFQAVSQSYQWTRPAYFPQESNLSSASCGARCFLAKAGEKTGDPLENPPTSGIIWHNFHVRKSGSEPALNPTRSTLVGGELSNHFTIAAPTSSRQVLFVRF